jgi:hypothetical protein
VLHSCSYTHLALVCYASHLSRRPSCTCTVRRPLGPYVCSSLAIYLVPHAWLGSCALVVSLWPSCPLSSYAAQPLCTLSLERPPLPRLCYHHICPAPSRTCSLVSEPVSSVHPTVLLHLHRHANIVCQTFGQHSMLSCASALRRRSRHMHYVSPLGRRAYFQVPMP